MVSLAALFVRLMKTFVQTLKVKHV